MVYYVRLIVDTLQLYHHWRYWPYVSNGITTDIVQILSASVGYKKSAKVLKQIRHILWKSKRFIIDSKYVFISDGAYLSVKSSY